MSGRYPKIVYTEEGMQVEGDWPWNEPVFPKPSAITNQAGQ
jgi:hypothetical protein